MTTSTTSPWVGLPACGPMLRPNDAAKYLGFATKQAYYHLARAGAVPAPIRIFKAGRASGVPKGWLDAIIQARADESAAA